MKHNLIHRNAIFSETSIDTSSSSSSQTTHTTSLVSTRRLIQEDYNKDVLTHMMTQGSFVGRKSHSSVIDIHTGSIYVLGGTSSIGNDLNDVWILDTFSGKFISRVV